MTFVWDVTAPQHDQMQSCYLSARQVGRQVDSISFNMLITSRGRVHACLQRLMTDDDIHTPDDMLPVVRVTTSTMVIIDDTRTRTRIC